MRLLCLRVKVLVFLQCNRLVRPSFNLLKCTPRLVDNQEETWCLWVVTIASISCSLGLRQTGDLFWPCHLSLGHPEFRGIIATQKITVRLDDSL